MGRKFLISVCDIDKRRFGRDRVTIEYTGGTVISGKLISVHPNAWDEDYGLVIEDVPMLRVSYGLVVEVEEEERPGDSREKPIIINNDNFKEEYIGKWIRWDDRPATDVDILYKRKVELSRFSNGDICERIDYITTKDSSNASRSFVRRHKAT